MKKEIYKNEEININYEQVEDVIKKLEKYKGLGAELEIDSYEDFGCASSEVSICYKRLETDEEYMKRQAIEENKKNQAIKRKEGKVEREKKKYEELKKKFG